MCLWPHSDGSSERREGLLGGKGGLCSRCGPQGPAWCPAERERGNRELETTEGWRTRAGLGRGQLLPASDNWGDTGLLL